MTRLVPAILVCTLWLSGTAYAQSFEPPSIPGFSGIPGIGVPQIDPPSLDFDTGPSNDGDGDGDSIPDFTEIGEAVDAARPKVREIVVVGSKVKEAVRSGLQQGRLILDSDVGAIGEAVRSGLQQGRLILDSDVGAIGEAVRSGLQQGRVILDSDPSSIGGDPKEDIEKTFTTGP